LLVTPSFLLYSSAQMADIPLSLYILTTVVLLQFAEAWPDVKSTMLALAGLSTGFAAWTKNEGLLLVIAVFVSHWISLALIPAWRGYRKHVLRFSLGLAPILILIVSFKVFLAPPSDIPLNMAAVERMTHVERYRQIVSAFVSHFWTFGNAAEAGGTNPGILMMLYLLLYRSRVRKVSVTSLSLLLLPVLMLCGYFMVYVITPHPLQEHLASSLDRLLLQLWPACIFALAVVPISMSADRSEINVEREHGTLIASQ
ncbi:MAG: hypothetical protein QOF64_653, partial [Candidatus Binatota bacterium]|nr:hypothetical protein [Candidatus Binatota bacterium]